MDVNFPIANDVGKGSNCGEGGNSRSNWKM